MSVQQDFEQFWRSFPRKVGKLAAEKEYQRARKRATADEILAGIQVYLVTKPAYADWCHPKTWLSQGRWLDEAPASMQAFVCPHTPKHGGRHECYVRTQLDAARAQRES
jgi:hypothetical protein